MAYRKAHSAKMLVAITLLHTGSCQSFFMYEGMFIGIRSIRSKKGVRS